MCITSTNSRKEVIYMSPVFNLGVDFSDVQDTDKFEPMPVATYSFQILDAISGETGDGRPIIKWTIGIIESEEYNNRQLFYNTPLPWEKNGQQDISGVGFLVNITKGVGKPWDGKQLVTEDYIGSTGQVEVKQKLKREQNAEGKWVNTDEVVNEVKKFVC